MEDTIRSACGNHVQTCTYLGVTPEIMPFTTLNQKLLVNDNVTPTNADHFALNYYCIGVGGHTFTTGANLVPRLARIRHRSTDTSLFNMIPFVMRTLDNDVTDAERQNLALRTIVTKDGVQYIAYFARRLDKRNVKPLMKYHTVVDGTESIENWIPGPSNANPVPTEPDSSGTVTVGGDLTSVLAEMGIILNTAQIADIMEAVRITLGDEDYAIISEIGFCTGFDKVVQISASNGTASMNEAMCVQIASFMSTLLNLQVSNKSASIELDVGAADPVYDLQNT